MSLQSGRLMRTPDAACEWTIESFTLRLRDGGEHGVRRASKFNQWSLLPVVCIMAVCTDDCRRTKQARLGSTTEMEHAT